MDWQDVRYETDGPIALISLNRPRYRNAQSWKLLDELDEALDRAQADRSVRVVVVRGQGDHFSAGHDLGTPEQIADLEMRGTPAVGIGVCRKGPCLQHIKAGLNDSPGLNVRGDIRFLFRNDDLKVR